MNVKTGNQRRSTVEADMNAGELFRRRCRKGRADLITHGAAHGPAVTERPYIASNLYRPPVVEESMMKTMIGASLLAGALLV
ncbi:hypothetical protein, partial [Streptosporangium sp. NPDC000396]|uniref:hypothetical protein n=1 Tax=Streptosporangium sp. NPDC000396 TaxID=3366185 RepID=UPI0036AF5DD3